LRTVSCASPELRLASCIPANAISAIQSIQGILSSRGIHGEAAQVAARARLTSKERHAVSRSSASIKVLCSFSHTNRLHSILRQCSCEFALPRVQSCGHPITKQQRLSFRGRILCFHMTQSIFHIQRKAIRDGWLCFKLEFLPSADQEVVMQVSPPNAIQLCQRPSRFLDSIERH
jgi:hypothetical protein